ncbi:MAG TPA: sulfatase-like hydrolase/transferase [Actinomycetota bacterium]|nr:sulfatase-like hydrolase/transferase [Actinomycetota bacterium]
MRRLLGGLPRELWWALLELFALTGFVVAQPLLDVAGKAPDFFVFHRASRGQILALVAVVVLLPAVGLWLLELAAFLIADRRGQRLVHLVLVTGLFAVLAVEVGKELLPLRARRLMLAAVVAGLVAGLVYARWSAAKLWLRYLAPAPLVFALVFVTISPVSQLILPASDGGQSTVPVRTSSEPLPPVVMVFFDEFPLASLLDSSGTIDERVYPNFAEFASHATWYRNATGIGGWTPYAVPGMLRGRYPGPDLKRAVPDISSYPDNLFTMFGHYYDLKVLETVTRLCPADRCGQTGSQSGFADLAKETAKLYTSIASPVDVPADPASVGQDPTVDEGAKDKGPTAYFGNLKHDQVRRVDTFMRSIDARDRQPTLYFLHLLLPHSPWKYLPDGRVYNSGSMPRPELKHLVWPSTVQQVNQERLLLQLAYTDKLIGKLIDRLRQQGLWDKSLVLMTADHGVGMVPGNASRSLGSSNAPGLMWVPMLIKAPHQTKGRVDDRNWEHVDLLPTLADMVGLSIPWKVDGFSQVGPPRRQRTDKTFYNHPGDLLIRPGPPNFRKVLEGVTDTQARAHQNGERGLYQFGSHADWIYKSPREVGRVAGSPVTVKITDWELFDAIDPGGPLVPSLVAGRVTSGTPPPGSVMVIAVNGRIGAAPGFYAQKLGTAPTSFGGVVPDFLYRKGSGRGQLQLYLATKAGGGYQLRPVTLSG